YSRDSPHCAKRESAEACGAGMAHGERRAGGSGNLQPHRLLAVPRGSVLRLQPLPLRYAPAWQLPAAGPDLLQRQHGLQLSDRVARIAVRRVAAGMAQLEAGLVTARR